jgi:gluconate 2-dehydrogenase gamma chain
MPIVPSSRRQFLFEGVAGVSAAWLSLHWPALVRAAEHARQQARSAGGKKLSFFTPEQAAEVDAISERILPAGETPGAREAGVVYFIDRALLTFAKDEQQTFRDGLPALQALTRKLFPNRTTFRQASPEQQDEVLRQLDRKTDSQANVFAAGPTGGNFFETVRWLVVAGFLVDPDTRGDADGIGWKLIGRDRAHAFTPPFGYYDKDYPGWQRAADSEKPGGDT